MTIYYPYRRTCLTMATFSGFSKVVSVIIEKIKESNPQGLQSYLDFKADYGAALSIAEDNYHQDIVAILKEAGATD